MAALADSRRSPPSDRGGNVRKTTTANRTTPEEHSTSPSTVSCSCACSCSPSCCEDGAISLIDLAGSSLCRSSRQSDTKAKRTPKDKQRKWTDIESPTEWATATCSPPSVRPLDRGRAKKAQAQEHRDRGKAKEQQGQQQVQQENGRTKQFTRRTLASVCLYSSVNANVNEISQGQDEEKAGKREKASSRQRRGRLRHDVGSNVEMVKTPGPGGQSRCLVFAGLSSPTHKTHEGSAAETTTSTTVTAAPTHRTSNDGTESGGADEQIASMTDDELAYSPDSSRTSPGRTSPSSTVTPDKEGTDEGDKLANAPFWPRQPAALSFFPSTTANTPAHYPPPYTLPTPPPLPPLYHYRALVEASWEGNKYQAKGEGDRWIASSDRHRQSSTLAYSPVSQSEGTDLPEGDGGILVILPREHKSLTALDGKRRQSSIPAAPLSCCPSGSAGPPLLKRQERTHGETAEGLTWTVARPPQDYPPLPLPYHDYSPDDKSSMARSRTMHVRKRQSEYDAGVALRPKRSRPEKIPSEDERQRAEASHSRSRGTRRSNSRFRKEQEERSFVRDTKRSGGKAKGSGKRCAVACESCRSFKRKCSGEIPCKLCIRRGKEHECRYDPGPVAAALSAATTSADEHGQAEAEPKQPPRFFGSRPPPSASEGRANVGGGEEEEGEEHRPASRRLAVADEQQECLKPSLPQTVEMTSSADSEYSGFEFDDAPPPPLMPYRPFAAAASEQIGGGLPPLLLSSPQLTSSRPSGWPRVVPYSAPSCLQTYPSPLLYQSTSSWTAGRPRSEEGQPVVWHGAIPAATHYRLDPQPGHPHSHSHSHAIPAPLSHTSSSTTDARSLDRGALNALVDAIYLSTIPP